jgi:hypothetical protein
MPGGRGVIRSDDGCRYRRSRLAQGRFWAGRGGGSYIRGRKGGLHARCIGAGGRSPGVFLSTGRLAHAGGRERA